MLKNYPENRFVDKHINNFSNDNSNKLSLSEIISVLVSNRWLIALSTSIIFIFGIVTAEISSSSYEAHALLQVATQSLSLTSLDPKDSISKSDIPISAEIELLNSRTTINDIVKNFNLDISAKPKRFPVIGSIVAKIFEKNNTDNDILSNFLGYAWGGEDIKIDALNLPTSLLNKPLRLVAGKPGYFQLMNKDEVILEGEVGKLATKKLSKQETPPNYISLLRSRPIEAGRFATKLLKNQENATIFISSLNALPNTEFVVTKQSEDSAFLEFEKHFKAAEKGKLTRIIELTYESSNPESASEIVNDVVNNHIRQNVELKSAELQNALEFLEKQLPTAKQQLDSSANQLNNFRTRIGSIDLDTESRNLLETNLQLNIQISQLQQKLDELRITFTKSHPSVIAVDKQIMRLREQVASNNQKIEALPKAQKEIIELSREVEVNTSLYTTILTKIQNLQVVKASIIGDVRVIDYATIPTLSVKPKKNLIILISLIMGLGLGIVVVLLRKILRRGIDDPDLIENILQIPVLTTVPHSRNQEKKSEIFNRMVKYGRGKKAPLALQNKDDLAIENLRSLRTALHFASLDAQNNVLMITGPSDGVGKTFVSINLAAVLANTGKKVLLIDGDLRKGNIHEVLGVNKMNGLSTILSTSISEWPRLLETAILKIPKLNLDFISTGSIPAYPSELLLDERFDILLDNMSKNYDHIIIDSPSVLTFTDAAIIGGRAGVSLMVVKSGEHQIRELKHCVKHLNLANVDIKGLVVNEV